MTVLFFPTLFCRAQLHVGHQRVWPRWAVEAGSEVSARDGCFGYAGATTAVAPTECSPTRLGLEGKETDVGNQRTCQGLADREYNRL